MTRQSRIDGPRKATNVSLNSELVAEAKRLGINVSRACEAGLERDVKKAAEAKWLEENRPAMEEWNRWIEKNGIPYSEHRRF